MKAEIIDHLDYEGGFNLSEYPGYEIGTVHDVTQHSDGEYLLNNDVCAAANEVKIIKD